MKNYKISIVTALLLSFSVTMITPAYAFSLSDVVPQANAATTTSNSSSSRGLIDILLGLLLGQFLGKATGGSSSGNTAPVSPTNQLFNVLGLNSDKTTKPTKTTQSTQSASTGKQIIETAKKYMGVPYVWGGTAPDGWDCSGYTQYVMKENGITLPRTAAEQFAKGTAVEKSELQAGDLVFFTTYKPGASHVGFYMGDGKFIHASSAAKEVTISELNDQYYVDHYIGARHYTR